MKGRFNRTKRRLLGGMIAIVMVFTTMVSTPTFAAENVCNHEMEPEDTITIQPRGGVENWGKTGEVGNYPGVHVGVFTCYNNNLTPVKTITESGEFYIWGKAWKADNLAGNVVTKIQIREYPSGRVLKTTESHSICTCGEEHEFKTPSIYLNAGQKIQIFFDVCSIGTPPGGYRSAKISYYYVLK